MSIDTFPPFMSERDRESGEWCWGCGAWLEKPRNITVPDKDLSPHYWQEQPLCQECWPKCQECSEPVTDRNEELCAHHTIVEERREKMTVSQHTKDWALAIILLILVLGLLNLYGPLEIPNAP